MQDIISYVRALGGVLVLEPREGDGSPEIAWGDVFFYYAPDGVVPRTQPFATVVTKDYPGEPSSGLDRSPGSFRVNVDASTEEFVRWTGRSPKDPVPEGTDVTVRDTVLPHPVYARQGWLCVVDPGQGPGQAATGTGWRVSSSPDGARSTVTCWPSRTSPARIALASWSPIWVWTRRRSGRAP